MINSFRQYLVEEEKTVYFTFGRMNPPTIGHGLLLESLAKKAQKNPYRVYLSHTNDPKKNPLEYVEKVKFVRKMFPKHSRSVMLDKKVKNVFDAAAAIYAEGYRNVVMVVGSDRVSEFKTLLNKYNGVEGRHGIYTFKTINVISAGERDPDAEGVSGASATKQRQAAADNDFVAFSQGLPKNFSNKDSKDLFNAVRKGMGLKEEKNFHNHIQLDPVSDEREKFVSGELFSIGESVIIKSTNERAKIVHRGANYYIVEKEDGTPARQWIDSLEKIEEKKTDEYFELGTKKYTDHAKKMTPGQKEDADERKKDSPQDPDIKDRPGTQPKAYHAGLKKKSTKVARDRHFKKHSKMDDDNPKAYKPAPGDATAETKPSKHTKKFKQVFGEESDPVKVARKNIKREKEADREKHDRLLDRARLARARMKNRQTR